MLASEIEDGDVRSVHDEPYRSKIGTGDGCDEAVELLDAGKALLLDDENRKRNECMMFSKFPMMMFWRMLFKISNSRLAKVD
jgi:hypothetical protein